MNDMKNFSTKDLHFAAFLKISGVELLSLERHVSEFRDRNPVFFIFGDKKRCEELENIFWNGGNTDERAMVNVKEYVDVVRDLRARTSSVNKVVEQ